jgi:Family of unknown function (DUF6174)
LRRYGAGDPAADVRIQARVGIFCCVALLTGIASGCSSVAATACAVDTGPAEAQRLWQSRHPSDYRFVWQQTCFCPQEAVQPMRITVRNGVITSATDLAGAEVSDAVRADLMTIDALYRHILDDKWARGEVRFACAGAGIPEQVYIDPNARVADDEFRVTISEFEPIP